MRAVVAQSAATPTVARRTRLWQVSATILTESPGTVGGGTGPDEATAELLEAAAERAERKGAMGVAVASLEESARLSPDHQARASRLLRAADLAYELGRFDILAPGRAGR